jgi:coproporphyrinogen III oxidase-like Fe-S oxidoreductase
MMQLRLNAGLSIAAFRERIGLDPRDSFGDALTRLVALGLVAVSETHIALTRSGRLVANSVIADLAAAPCPVQLTASPEISNLKSLTEFALPLL